MNISLISNIPLIRATLIGLVFFVGSSAALGQNYPARTVRIISSFGTGGSNDFVARLLAQQLTSSFGQSFIVENRAGAGGVIGTEYGARAAPDGYTLTLVTSAMLINAAIRPLSFDPTRDFSPIALVGITPYIFIVNPALPVRNLKEIIAIAKVRPNDLDFGTAGIGTPGHLAGAMLLSTTGIKMTHVPYKSATVALTELMGGHIATAFSTTIASTQVVKAGKLRAIAVTSAQRASALPDLVTFQESGVPGYDFSLWLGLAAPKGTPEIIVNQVSTEIAKALRQQSVIDQVKLQSIEVQFSPPREFAKKMTLDAIAFEKIVLLAGLQNMNLQ